MLYVAFWYVSIRPVVMRATKFLGIELDANINWKNHAIKLIPRLGSACYLIRKPHASCSIDALK